MAAIGNSKPLASLSSGLLARKGQARPAMRPQGFHGTGLSLEDLGWNDMGDAPEFVAPAPVQPLLSSIEPPAEAPVPPVLVERRALRREFDEPVAEPAPAPAAHVEEEVRPVSIATAARIQREVRAGKPRAAFTLRLDPERHLRLRLASACRNRSAQALVTEALDAFIASLPEVEPLVGQLSRPDNA
ncbi:hypothetical protein LZK98_13280 [Sphingomonas cannabina]|uniref:hypothetical protein n=1 Tax=Sphingomonas cannabina TaxID=2899123 RepID=UPI001F259230|nr:hypothetical protein [Sphingomonas cannabina]UIJ44049.1 hypothetical protein LZK98_13280 [Sphingomonas cannabina]